jgi:hypothetical protein
MIASVTKRIYIAGESSFVTYTNGYSRVRGNNTVIFKVTK